MKAGAYRKLAAVWLALVLLLALTCASAFVPLGAWNTVVNFAVAGLKALLVALFFMHLFRRPAYRAVALAALFVLAVLLGLSLADYSTRAQQPAAWQAPRADYKCLTSSGTCACKLEVRRAV